jgi:transcriptional regulator with XRE-family HTH domain
LAQETADVQASKDGVDRSARLGAFIRLHRQRVPPETAGLVATARRRTPGLRREDLAHLCKVSVTWITWLEQGRQVAASAAVLARLAVALRLSPAERAYLFDLAGRRDPSDPALEAAPRSHAVLRSVASMQCPAYVLDRRWDVVAANERAADLFLDWGRAQASVGTEPSADACPPNLLRFLFMFPPSRSLIHDWNNRSWRLVAEFRADCGRLVDTPLIGELVDELSAASPDFAGSWQTQDVLEREGGERRFHHPAQGDLRYEQVTLHPAVRNDLKVVMLL